MHVVIFTLCFSAGGCRSSSKDGSHGSAHASAERQGNQGPAHHQGKRNQPDWYETGPAQAHLMTSESSMNMTALAARVKCKVDLLHMVWVRPLQSAVVSFPIDPLFQPPRQTVVCENDRPDPAVVLLSALRWTRLSSSTHSLCSFFSFETVHENYHPKWRQDVLQKRGSIYAYSCACVLAKTIYKLIISNRQVLFRCLFLVFIVSVLVSKKGKWHYSPDLTLSLKLPDGEP